MKEEKVLEIINARGNACAHEIARLSGIELKDASNTLQNLRLRGVVKKSVFKAPCIESRRAHHGWCPTQKGERLATEATNTQNNNTRAQRTIRERINDIKMTALTQENELLIAELERTQHAD